MEKNNKNKSFFRILIVGCNYVGLTAFFHKLSTGKFDPYLLTNLGIDFRIMKIEMNDGKKISFIVYDTKAQESKRNLTISLFKGADGIILMYSIDSKESFDFLEYWINMLKRENSFEIPIYLLGNKNDLEMEREITKKQGAEYAEKYGFIFSECSVKNDSGDKIKSIFEDLAKVVYEVFLGNNKSKIIEQLNMKNEEMKEIKEIKEKRVKNKLKILKKYLNF